MALRLLAPLVCAACLLAGCAPEEGGSDKDMHLNAPSAPKTLDAKAQMKGQGLDPNTDMSGVGASK